MNILVVTPYYKPSYTFGGPVNSISKIAESLSGSKGIHLEVFTTNANGTDSLPVETNKEINVDGVKVRYFKRYSPNNSFFIAPGLTLQLIKTIRRFDIIHVNMWWNWVSILSGLLAILYGKKLVVAPRGSITEYIVNYKNSSIKKAIHAMIGKWILNRAHFHLTSNVELVDTRKVTKVNRFSIIYNLIDLPVQVPVSYATGNETFTIIFMSRVHPKKGIELLLQAIAMIETPLILKIAGDGEPEYVDTLKRLIADLKIEEKVVWLGWLDNTRKFEELAKSDLFALTSYNENFANVVVESLFVGTPVLITNEVGLSDFVRENKLGWTVSCDAKEIGSTLETISVQKQQLSEMRQRARGVISNTFTEQQLVAEYISMYQTLLK
jgi:glycosyltransferase involved in cell wall biosynthesis